MKEILIRLIFDMISAAVILIGGYYLILFLGFILGVK